MKNILFMISCIITAFALLVMGTNEAKAVTATASSVHSSGFEADKTIDGDPETRWSSEFSGAQWIQIDYGTVQLIQGLSVLIHSNVDPNSFTVEYKDGGGVLQPAYNQVIYASNGVTILFDPVDTSAVRLNMTGGLPSILEIKSLFGVAAVASTEHPSNYPEFTADKAVDGNSGTRWSASTDADGWIEFHYPELQIVQGLSVYFNYANLAGLSVEYRDGNGILQSVSNQTISTNGAVQILFDPVVTRTIRLNMTNNAGLPSVVEIEILSDVAAIASTNFSGDFNAAKAIDGNLGTTRWSANTDADGWIELRYASAQIIKGMAVVPLYFNSAGLSVEYKDELGVLQSATNQTVTPGDVWNITFDPVVTRVIRLNMTNNAPGAWPSLYEIEAILGNVAATASSEHPSAFPEFLASRVIDGDLNTRWSSEFSGAQWIHLTYAQTGTIQGLKIAIHSNVDPNSFAVEYADENGVLQSVSNQEIYPGEIYTVLFDPVETSVVRLNMTGGLPSLREVEGIFGIAVVASTEFPQGVDFVSGKAIDGDFVSRWSASTSADGWFQLSYSEPHLIGGLSAAFNYAAGLYVEYADQNGVLQVAGNQAISTDGFVTISFCPVETRVIRLNMVNNSGFPSIYEIEALEAADVVDTTPPDIYTVVNRDGNVIWPPNHQMVEVVRVEVDDPCADIVLTATSDEPTATAPGAGGAGHAPDAELVSNEDGSYSVLVRAERSGKGDGRVYVVTVTATDASGNTSGAVNCSVSVPNSQGRSKGGAKTEGGAIDSGQIYDAAGIN